MFFSFFFFHFYQNAFILPMTNTFLVWVMNDSHRIHYIQFSFILIFCVFLLFTILSFYQWEKNTILWCIQYNHISIIQIIFFPNDSSQGKIIVCNKKLKKNKQKNRKKCSVLNWMQFILYNNKEITLNILLRWKWYLWYCWMELKKIKINNLNVNNSLILKIQFNSSSLFLFFFFLY